MIEEEYVSFETAKLLKEKGFNEKVICYYDDGGSLNLNKFVEFQCCNQGYGSGVFAAPTLQKAMKWLRKVHNIQIELNWDKGNQLYSFQIWKPEKFQPEISSLDLWRIYKDDNYLGEWIYEQSCEEAIKYCLEHLI